MRILTYLEWLEASGGAEQSIVQLMQEMAARGHQVDIAYVREGNLSSTFSSFCEQMIRTPPIRYSATPLRELPDILRAVARTRGCGPDVIYTNNVSELAWAAGVRALARAPIVSHLRDVGAWRQVSVRTLGRIVSAYVANSQFVRSRWSGQGLPAGRIEVVPNAVPLDRYAPATQTERDSSRRELGIPADAFVVVYMGRLVRLKGVEVLLEAWRELGYPFERSRLLIFGAEEGKIDGDQGYAQGLMSRAPGGVEWRPMTNRVTEVLHAADVAVLPSLRDEAFGRILIEAMAAGVPAVASAVGGIPEVLDGEFAGFLFPAGDSPALTERLRALSGWRNSDPDLAARCRRHVERRYSLPANADQMERIFTAAAGSKAG